MYLPLPPHLRLTVAATLCTAAFGTAGACWAQTTHTADPKADKAAPSTTAEVKSEAAQPKLQVVQVKGARSLYDPRRDDTASKVVVNAEEITKYGDTNVLDVLKRVPGITVDQGGSGGGQIRMRGLAGNYTQILINGERAPAGFTIDQIPPEMIEKIEVLRAASAEYSTQSIAGTINVITKQAVKLAVRELKVQLGGDRVQFSPNANFNLSDKSGNLSWSLNGAVNRNIADRAWPTFEDGYDAAGERILHRDMESHEHPRSLGANLAPRLSWQLDGGDTFTLQGYANTNRNATPGHFHSHATLGAEQAYPEVDYRNASQGNYQRADVNWVHRLESGDKLDLKFGVFGGKWDSQNGRAGAHSVPGGPLLDNYFESDSDERGLSTSGKYTSSLFDGHSLVVGWNGGYSTRDDARRELDRGVELPHEDFDAQVTRLAVFAQDEFNLSERWSMYLGARWEGYQTETGGTSVEEVSARTSVLSPIFQTLYKLPDSRDQLRLALTRTYKAPPVGNLIPRRFTSTNNSQTEPDR
ncbi:MAG: TonB-dependent receptor plug domain-containing protein, partial [Gammaproteobacteria bacterium]